MVGVEWLLCASRKEGLKMGTFRLWGDLHLEMPPTHTLTDGRCQPVLSALKRLRQEDHKLKANLTMCLNKQIKKQKRETNT